MNVQLLAAQDTFVVFGGEPHASPHEPQSFTFDARFASQPLEATPSQLPKPAVQLVTSHVPPLHADVALARLHTFPQPPQLFGSESSFTQAPPQFVRPAPHVRVQAPAEQTSPPAQTCPQLPQFDGSVAMATHLPPQSDCPVGHEQTPPLQVWPAAHAFVQLPQ